MDSFVTEIAGHGYAFLLLAVFLESIGFPIPAALALIIAGGAAATGGLAYPIALIGSISVMLIGDMLMFMLGRHTGWWLLGILCRLSLNPESCILRSADAFYRKGRTVLLFAKFVPGINTMAPPLAGSMNMRFPQFLGLDLLGTMMYITSYLSVGYLFSDALEAITHNYQIMTGYLGRAILAAIAVYIVYQCWVWTRASAFLKTIPLVEPKEVIRGPQTSIFDVRSHGYYDPRAERIPGSKRLDPNALNHVGDIFPPGHRIYLYCTCIHEATSARIAHTLRERGIQTAVIRGGLKAWQNAGLYTERVPTSEISSLPVFEQ